jgi:hypothetical protein
LSEHLIPDVVSVKYLGAHRLRLRFDNGAEGEVDLFPRLTFTGVFVPLEDPDYFARVRVDPESGTICWPNEANLDPLVLHSWVTGDPIPDFGADAVAEDL